ncbi:MAG: hypothetical protein IJV82_02060 [Oscillospiraceae bacterium]|nr:hypothetical protein [Oscillospiraceae bacterium]
MRVGYIFLAMLSLIFAMAVPGAAPEMEQSPSVLIIGAPCACMAGVPADVCDAELELGELLAGREYRWIVLCLGKEARLEEYQQWIGIILRTQPQARTVIQSTDDALNLLATAHQMECADCCQITKMIQEDEKLWKRES